MNLINIKTDLSIRGKNGLPFIASATLIWTIMTIIFLMPLPLKQQNIFILMTTGLMFPLSVLMAKVLKAEWKFKKDTPLADLGLYLNLAQFIYFPIVFWALIKSPTEMILFFAIITGAHFFPYGWFYHTNVYYIFAPITAVLVTIIGFFANGKLWLIPLTIVILLLIMILLLYIDYKKKRI
ncbi:DUF7010 family protein [Pseudogracilibacillus auburnensis]|uniref:Uncharacterized protein n=1 Tax=Pseudogracilibacillus auburnensis TaxID=1494959 RepID=A0A2V3VTZ7_9BACI|nr:hypothetical protein [Pseudogracilibacillus auburnensis]MBO1004577.1 hypothetical protein [Pseudogracilibacillus auburnensis]PXW85130.1 hypothetical protein DFR56_112108 [Pseudogracilibacillus auburnensis]